jgi:competence protein ComEC
VPAQRTVLMLAATAVLRSVGLDWPASLVALAAMLPVTLLDPWALLQPGYWLSFAAVGLLMVSEPVRAVSGDAAPARAREGARASVRDAGAGAQADAGVGMGATASGPGGAGALVVARASADASASASAFAGAGAVAVAVAGAG